MSTTVPGPIALLAPVPLVHLWSAQDVPAPNLVAFGSDNVDLFLRLSQEGEPVDVYIVASRVEAAKQKYPQREPEIFWCARYRGWGWSSETEISSVRPESTFSDTPFTIFWKVSNLEPLPKKRPFKIAEMIPFGREKPYGEPFMPQGPILIEHP